MLTMRVKLFLATLLVATAAARGQVPGLPGNPLAGHDAAQGVYVRDSAVAMEKLALAERMERLKEWDKSADVYQVNVEKNASRVVPNQTDAAVTAKRYSSVTLEVQRRLSKWPDEGIRAYK